MHQREKLARTDTHTHTHANLICVFLLMMDDRQLHFLSETD